MDSVPGESPDVNSPAVAGDEEHGSGHEQEEAINARVAVIPKRPPQEEVDAHVNAYAAPLLVPALCAWQIQGKPHSMVKQRTREIPTVSVDYMFMHEAQELDAERGMPILVMRDVNSGGCGTGMIFARVVPAKGVNPYAVKNTAADIASLGHPELIGVRGLRPNGVFFSRVREGEGVRHREKSFFCSFLFSPFFCPRNVCS